MKLAVVVDTFPRWSERFIARECRELLRRGVDLSIFCLRAGDELPRDEHEWDGLIERRIVLPRCLMPSLRSESHLPAAVRARRELVRETLGATAYAKVRCAESLTELLRTHGVTHVHAHFASLPSTIGWLAATECGLTFTFSVHARDLFVDAQLLAQKAADAAAIFCCHGKAFEFLKKEHPAAKAIHMPHGLPLELFPRRAKNPVGVPHLLAAGRFVEKKGFFELLEALAEPELLKAEWTATLLGDGPLRAKLKARVERLRLGERVKLVDAVSGDALRAEFERAALFVAPYKETADGDADGIANVLLEAMALGVPVVATQSGSAREVVTEATATVIAECSAGAIGAGIGKAIVDSARTVKCADAARALIEERFDVRKNMDVMAREFMPQG